MPKQRSGFTLIEMSIVLVIVGLLVGSVLVVRDMIEASQVRAQISQIEKLNTAVNTFRVKYDAMPGDMSNAVAMGLGSNTAWHNGDGNRLIDTYCYMYSFNAGYNYNKEAFALVKHLASANLIGGAYEGYAGEGHASDITRTKYIASMPRAAFSDNAIIVPSRFAYSINCGPVGASYSSYLRDGGNGWAIINLPVDGETPFFQPTLSESAIYRMDTKMDDGLPLTGSVGVSNLSWGSTVFALKAVVGGEVAATYDPGNSSKTMRPVFLNQY